MSSDYEVLKNQETMSQMVYLLIKTNNPNGGVKYRFLAIEQYNKDFTPRAKYACLTHMSMAKNLVKFMTSGEVMYIIHPDDFTPFKVADNLTKFMDMTKSKTMFASFKEVIDEEQPEGSRVFYSKSI